MKISVLIPCYNEENTVAACIESVLGQSRPADEIIVVNDGSTDGTRSILASFGHSIRIVDTPQNTGNKSHAQEYGLQFVTGDIFVTTDADSLLAPDFIERIEKDFADPSVEAVAGYIKSVRMNWLTACRELDYVIGQDLHKKAQSHLNAILVIPGCAGAFRTHTFRKHITFDHDTVTEDLDFTYKYHKNEFRILFDTKAVVYTQDPFTLYSYIHQMRRWIGGGWQNLLKHWRVVARRPGHAVEIGFVYIEGTVFGLLFFILPLINVFYFITFFSGYFLVAGALGLYGAIARKRYDLALYAPLFPIVLIINSLIFLEQFVREVVFRRRTLHWFKPERQALNA